MAYSNSKISHVIAGFGNPLVDISVLIEDCSIIDKFNLTPDGQKEVSSKELHDILNYVKRNNYRTSQSPGGCTQNTLRVIQFLVKHPKFSVFFGGLGIDKEGEYLESQLSASGVDIRYAKLPQYPTGMAASLISGENRSLVAHIGAAEQYTLNDFLTPGNLDIMEEVVLVYIEGFFITHSFDVVMEAMNLCERFGATRVLNISGVYVAKSCPESLLAVAKQSDIVLGNSEEFKALAMQLGMRENLPWDEILLKVHSYLWNSNNSVVDLKLKHFCCIGKTVVMTNGKNPVLCVGGDTKLVKYKVPQVDVKLIKDPTGTGDAFAAGFLVALTQNKALYDCLQLGCEAAQIVLQKVGV